MEVQDRVVYCGQENFGKILPIGSSGKVREILVCVGWGRGNETWHSLDGVTDEIVSPQRAAELGIEPWASEFSEYRDGEERE